MQSGARAHGARPHRVMAQQGFVRSQPFAPMQAPQLLHSRAPDPATHTQLSTTQGCTLVCLLWMQYRPHVVCSHLTCALPLPQLEGRPAQAGCRRRNLGGRRQRRWRRPQAPESRRHGSSMGSRALRSYRRREETKSTWPDAKALDISL